MCIMVMVRARVERASLQKAPQLNVLPGCCCCCALGAGADANAEKSSHAVVAAGAAAVVAGRTPEPMTSDANGSAEAAGCGEEVKAPVNAGVKNTLPVAGADCGVGTTGDWNCC